MNTPDYMQLLDRNTELSDALDDALTLIEQLMTENEYKHNDEVKRLTDILCGSEE